MLCDQHPSKEQSERGLFTFYKQEEEHQKYLRNLEKRKEIKHKNKSKSKNKSKKKRQKVKSQGKLQSIIEKSEIKKDYSLVDIKTEFLKKILNNKITIPLARSLQLNQLNSKEQVQNINQSTLQIKQTQHEKKISDNESKQSSSINKNSSRLHMITEQRSESQLKCYKQRMITEQMMDHKVKSNFFRLKTENTRKNEAQKLKYENTSTSKKIPKQQSLRLPYIKQIRMSKALHNIHSITEKKLVPVHRYNSTKLKASPKKNIYQQKLTALLKEKSESTLGVSKVNIAESHEKLDLIYNEWEARKRSIIKKLGMGIKI